MSFLRALIGHYTRPDIVVLGERVIINRAPKGLTLKIGGESSPSSDSDRLGAALDDLNDRFGKVRRGISQTYAVPLRHSDEGEHGPPQGGPGDA